MRKQIWVPIEFPLDIGIPSRKSRRWVSAIVAIEKKLRAEGVSAKMTTRLPIPSIGVAAGWTVTRRSIRFRCLYQWAMMGTPYDPNPRFIGRVDVAYIVPE